MNKSLNALAGIIIFGIIFIYGIGIGIGAGNGNKIDNLYYIALAILVIVTIVALHGTNKELQQDPNNPKIKKNLLTKIFLWVAGIFVAMVIVWALLSLYIVQK